MSPERPPAAPRPPVARVFFALWPPAELAATLAGAAKDFAHQAGGRPSRQETLHLTLAFLGDVPISRLPELQAAAQNVRGPAFELTLDRFGLWQHNRIFWTGCTQPPPALGTLAASLMQQVQDSGFPVPDAQRPFVPHMTLVRKVAHLQTPVPQCAPQRWMCREFVLVRSRVSESGADYAVLARFPLVG